MWHRAFIMWFERELQKISNNASFTIPYWDWLNRGRDCDICTNDLVGESRLVEEPSPIDSSSPFSHWHAICKNPNETNLCWYCNFTNREEKLTRSLLPYMTFPDTKQYKATFNFTHYDEYPYDKYSKGGFRVAMEGFYTANSMHNVVIIK